MFEESRVQHRQKDENGYWVSKALNLDKKDKSLGKHLSNQVAKIVSFVEAWKILGPGQG